MQDGYSKLYVWNPHGQIYGSAGDVPRIFVWVDELAEYGIPPLEKASSIGLHSLYNKPEESELHVSWITKESGVRIKVAIHANHPEFKAFLKRNPDIADKFIDLLVQWSEQPNHYESLTMNEELEDVDIPEKIAPFVKQIPIWRKFLKPFRKGNAPLRYQSSISRDGFYRLLVSDEFFKAAIDNWAKKDNNIPSSEYWDYPLFDFDPKKRPPIIEDDAVYWELSDKKVAVILPFASADEHLADYYGFRPQYDEFVKKKEEARKKDAENRANDDKGRKEQEEKERKKKAEELKEALLG